MITKFKIFENNSDNDYLINNLSEKCLYKLGFFKTHNLFRNMKNTHTTNYFLKLSKNYNLLDTLIISGDNGIFLNSLSESRITIDNDPKKTTKIFFEKYQQYYDTPNKHGEDYVELCIYNDTFISRDEYKKILMDDYVDNYIYILDEATFVRYKPVFDKLFELIEKLQSSDKECYKNIKTKEFNL